MPHEVIQVPENWKRIKRIRDQITQSVLVNFVVNIPNYVSKFEWLWNFRTTLYRHFDHVAIWPWRAKKIGEVSLNLS